MDEPSEEITYEMVEKFFGGEIRFDQINKIWEQSVKKKFVSTQGVVKVSRSRFFMYLAKVEGFSLHQCRTFLKNKRAIQEHRKKWKVKIDAKVK